MASNAAPVLAVATHASFATKQNQLTFKKGDRMEILEQNGLWWTARLGDQEGLVPSNRVKLADVVATRASGSPRSPSAVVSDGHVAFLRSNYSRLGSSEPSPKDPVHRPMRRKHARATDLGDSGRDGSYSASYESEAEAPPERKPMLSDEIVDEIAALRRRAEKL
eukprot:a682522_4.p1 GENE.a682522_4~~a682522_4.p1  ORF type:complete len:193 (-),score=38.44 a682522_4:178-672(-)